MASWTQTYTNSTTFLSAGGTSFGSLGGGPINPGVFDTQPLADSLGNLRANYSCGGVGAGDCGCDCGTPMPPGANSGGVDDSYLCLHWLSFVS